MPKGPVPERYRDLLESRALGHLATIGADGRPQVNPVWFIADGEHVRVSVKQETVKFRNLEARPWAAISIADSARSERSLELRGEVTGLDLCTTLDWVNVLAR